MDNPRIFLWIGLALLVWMNVIQWNKDYASSPATAPAVTAANPAEPNAGTSGAASQLPSLPTAQPDSVAPAAAGVPTVPAPTAQPTIRVVTDVLDLSISLQGGELVRADLLKYPHDKHPGSPPVRLLDTQELDYQVLRTGLRSSNGGPEPTHLAVFSSAAAEYRMAPGAQELRVPLTWTDGAGVTVTKTFVFRPGSYAIDLVYDVDNKSATDWSGASYVQDARRVYSRKRSMFDVESYAYRGPAVYDGSSYRKLDVTDEDDSHY